jgi:hypothetical protein
VITLSRKVDNTLGGSGVGLSLSVTKAAQVELESGRVQAPGFRPPTAQDSATAGFEAGPYTPPLFSRLNVSTFCVGYEGVWVEFV